MLQIIINFLNSSSFGFSYKLFKKIQYFKFSFSSDMVNLSMTFILGILYVLIYIVDVCFFNGLSLYRDNNVRNREVKITLNIFGPVVEGEQSSLNVINLIHCIKYPKSRGLYATLDVGILSFVRSYLKQISKAKPKLNLEGKFFLYSIEIIYIEPYKLNQPIIGDMTFDELYKSTKNQLVESSSRIKYPRTKGKIIY